MSRFDFALVGGGLQNALIAEALLSASRGVRIAIIERDSTLGGNHTWSFHCDDVPAGTAFVAPFVVHRWPRHQVRFPDHARVLEQPYAALTSQSVDRVLRARAERGELVLYLSAAAERVEGHRVKLADGRELEAGVVVDARGPERSTLARSGGYQKFVGLELEVRPGDAPREPLLMDACVEQIDGFRFVYLLPFAPDRLLVEDTYFSDTPELDVATVRARITGYLAERGIEPQRVLRVETGVLPLPSRHGTVAPREDQPILAGYQGGWFHPTTGYSLPCAVRFAREVAAPDRASLIPRLQRLARDQSRQQRFAALLNRLLFEAMPPEHRRGVLARFYRLPADTIRRFYALESTASDRMRILCGLPPKGFSVSRLWSGSQRDVDRGLQGEHS